MSIKLPPLIWIDLEMTGLDVNQNTIVEIATIVTDGNLNTIAEGPNLVIHQSAEKMSKMCEWVLNQHTASGLVDRVAKSQLSVREAEKNTLAFLKKHAEKGQSPMCGNSVHTDRKFLEAYMPELAEFFHYRNVDVSSVKELARRWYPGMRPYEKVGAHLALSDIRESIEELRHLRNLCFIEGLSS